MNSGLPFEWIEDDKRAFCTKLAAHRDLLGRVLAHGETVLSSMTPEWVELKECYESLSQYLVKVGL